MTRYSNALKTICEYRSIPFLDLYHCSNLRPWTQEGRQACYTKDNGNGVHPDESGHKLIAPRFKVFVESLLYIGGNE
jgi:lysophospholipase L1-like esterase